MIIKVVNLFFVGALAAALSGGCQSRDRPAPQTSKREQTNAGSPGAKGNPGRRRNPSRSPANPDDGGNPIRGRNPAPGIPGGYEVAYDFMHNKAHALFYTRHGLVMRCGDPGFVKFLDGTWSNPWILDQTIGGKAVAYMNGDHGWIVFPAPLTGGADQKETKYGKEKGDRAKGRAGPGNKAAAAEVSTPTPADQHVLSMVVHNEHKSQAMHVSLNGRYIQKSIRVPVGRHEIRVMFDPRLLQPGDNVIRLSLLRTRSNDRIPPADWRAAGRYGMRGVKVPKTPAAFEAIGIGRPGFRLPREAERPDGFTRKTNVLGAEKQVFALPPSGKMAFYIMPPATGKLFFRHSGPKTGPSKGRFVVRLTADGEPVKTVYQVEAGAAVREGWKTGTVDLSQYRGRAVRLEFVNEGVAGMWADVKLYAKPAPKLEIKKRPIKYVFFYVSDTLRRDCVGVYGSKEARTPNFDAFSRQAVMFEQATIQGNHSKPSHGTILSGTYPPVHGYEHKSTKIRETLLYEMFKKTGWKTAMYSSNGYISARWGFDRGLDKYVNTIRSRMDSETEYLWNWSRQWFKKNMKDRVFMYILTIDPHVTYDPPDEFLKMYWPGPYRGPIPRRMTGDHLARLIVGKIQLRGPEDLKRLKALYLGEVSYNDHWFGEMLKDLKKMGVYDQSVIVMTSDHGDQFKERGSFGHAKTLHQEEIAMPLLLWWPGLPKEGIRIPWDVEVMDLYSTILDIAGIKQNPTAQSASLLPLIRGGRAEAMHAAFSYNFALSRSVKMGRYKLILYDPSRNKLFDLKTDPGEKERLEKTRPVALRLLRNVFSLHNGYLSRWRKARWGRASNLDPRFNRDFKRPKRTPPPPPPR